MIHGNVRVPTPINEPVRNYAPGDPARAEVKEALRKQSAEKLDIPIVIGGK
jgi:1-pyrroline-5-carboxylate dehydrogenase